MLIFSSITSIYKNMVIRQQCLNIYIIKRFMQTETTNEDNKFLVQKNKRNKPQIIDDNEIQENPKPENLQTEINLDLDGEQNQSTIRKNFDKIYEYYSKKKEIVNNESIPLIKEFDLNTQNTIGNQFINPEETKQETLFNSMTENQNTIQLLDGAVKIFCNKLDNLGQKYNIEIEKSKELADKWDTIKIHLQKYMDSLSTYKTTFKYIACGISVMYLIYQMGIYRKLPDFLINLVSHIPLPNVKTNTLIESQTTFKTIMEIPINPLTIITSVGIGTTMFGIIKLSLWIIRKIKK